ncbi:MAG: HlyC/CorC family transporter [Bacteroidetes bacterium]|nr:MAG: HlyC/CorC family transporter [Bacteroidota bacterium]
MDILTIIIVSLLFSAFFSGMEIAYITANKLKVEVEKKTGGFSARILSRFTNSDSGFISTMLVGNNIALVIYGIFIAIVLRSFLESILPSALQSDFVILLAQTIISASVILLFAEFLPKTLFRINPNKILNFFAIPVYIIYYLLYPIVFITLGLSEFILRKIFNIKMANAPKTFDSVDIENFLHEFGDNDPRNTNKESIEMQIFRNAIDFPDIKLRESMIPRTEVIALDEKESLQCFRDKFSEKGLSKILIFRKSIDNVVGYVHAFDFFKKPKDIKSIIRPVMLVPETMHVNKLLKSFIQQRKSIAVVVDEFGGTAGLITIEDIMEEIFGEIDDEYDTDDFIEKRLSPDEFIFSARLEIDYLNDKYNFNLPESEEYETLGGLIINQHESIPAKDEEILIKGYTFKVIQVSEKRVEQVQLKITGD